MQKLGEIIISLARNEIENNKATPEVEQLFKWELETFEYTEKGPLAVPATGKHYLQETWACAKMKLYQVISTRQEFKDCSHLIHLNYLTELYPMQL